MKIERSIFRYVEHELYNYDNTKKELEQYRETILEGSPAPSEVKVQGGAISKPTEQKAIQLTSSAYLAKAERVIGAIDKSLVMLSDNHRKLFQLKYQKGLPWQKVAINMGIAERTYFKLRRELVITVAQQLGLVNVS